MFNIVVDNTVLETKAELNDAVQYADEYCITHQKGVAVQLDDTKQVVYSVSYFNGRLIRFTA